LKKFKKDYCYAPGGKADLAVQGPHLAKLAEGYLTKYKKTGKWTDIVKVSRCIVACKEHSRVQVYNTHRSQDSTQKYKVLIATLL